MVRWFGLGLVGTFRFGCMAWEPPTPKGEYGCGGFGFFDCWVFGWVWWGRLGLGAYLGSPRPLKGSTVVGVLGFSQLFSKIKAFVLDAIFFRGKICYWLGQAALYL